METINDWIDTYARSLKDTKAHKELVNLAEKHTLTLNAYQSKATKTLQPNDDNFKTLMALVLGLSGETGEVTEKFKKFVRDQDGLMTFEQTHEVMKELGDVLWYVTLLAEFFDYSLESVAKLNINKLESRKKRNKLSGSGDNR